ncbi:hypothetical protein ACOSP7_010128 [Xanthoceras sorbifolium]
MKMSNSGSEQRDHQRDHGTARCARDEGGGNAPVSTATWWRDHRSRRRSRRPKNIKKKNWLPREATKQTEERKERVRPRKKERRRRKKEKEEERKKTKKKEEEEEEEEEEKRKEREKEV